MGDEMRDNNTSDIDYVHETNMGNRIFPWTRSFFYPGIPTLLHASRIWSSEIRSRAHGAVDTGRAPKEVRLDSIKIEILTSTASLCFKNLIAYASSLFASEKGHVGKKKILPFSNDFRIL